MRSIILVFCWICFPAMATTMEMVEVRENRYSAGLGVEGRMQEDVNPEVKETRALPQGFAQFRHKALGLSLEGGYQETDSESGALNIESRTYQMGLWGRYEFGESLRWSPFADFGGGYFVDQVTSQYQDQSDERTGWRRFMGFGGGISHAAWKHLLLEGEMRAALIQDRKDAAYSAILRVGFIL